MGDLTVNISAMTYSSPESSKTIEGLKFKVPAGSFTSILGPSGAGKTTLLRIIAGLENRFDGHIELDDKPITKPTRSIQLVFQDYRLLPWKNVIKNVEFAARNAGPGLNKGIVAEWLAKVRLTHKEKSWPKDLSGGEEGRVAFARTFIDPPRVLLLDEPFRNLDLFTKFELQDLLLETLSGNRMTVLMVSHNIEDALFFSDRIHIMSKSPMSIEESVDVDMPRRRNRNDTKFRDLAAQITAHLLNSKSGTQTPK